MIRDQAHALKMDMKRKRRALLRLTITKWREQGGGAWPAGPIHLVPASTRNQRRLAIKSFRKLRRGYVPTQAVRGSHETRPKESR